MWEGARTFRDMVRAGRSSQVFSRTLVTLIVLTVLGLAIGLSAFDPGNAALDVAQEQTQAAFDTARDSAWVTFFALLLAVAARRPWAACSGRGGPPATTQVASAANA